MNTHSKVMGSIVLVLIIVLGAWYLMARNVGSNTAMTGTTANGAQNPQMSDVTVTLTPDGFSPKTVTILPGTKVVFLNKSSGQMEVASDQHPTHVDHDGTDRATHCAEGYAGPAPFDQCRPNPIFVYAFDKEGTWTYHNHLDPRQTGTIIVTSGPSAAATTTVEVSL